MGGVFCPEGCSDGTGRMTVRLARRRDGRGVSVVSRRVVVLMGDEYGEILCQIETIGLALARCPRCGRRWRLLPCDVLPYKRYTLEVIGCLLQDYASGKRSLRKAVWRLLGNTPAHTTLWGWTDGLGDYVRGRPDGEMPGAVPASAILEETARRFRGMRAEQQRRRNVNPRRYRSEERRIRLEAVATLLAIAKSVGGLMTWHRLIVTWFGGGGLGFRSARRCTRVEQVGSDSSLRSSQTRSRRKTRWPIGGRSPPGGTS
jgi:hypothetical protein